MRYTIYISLLLLAGVAHAGAGWSPGGISITQLASGTDGNLLWTSVTWSEGCENSALVRVDDASPNLNRIWALASMAFLSNLRVQFYLSGGCLGQGAKITDIRVTN